MASSSEWLAFGCVFPLCRARPAVEPNRQRATRLEQRRNTSQRHLRIHEREVLSRSEEIGRLGDAMASPVDNANDARPAEAAAERRLRASSRLVALLSLATT